MTTTRLNYSWKQVGLAVAEEASRNQGPVVWCADEVNGFARLLNEGETRAQAVTDFESAGEKCVNSRVYRNGEWE